MIFKIGIVVKEIATRFHKKLPRSSTNIYSNVFTIFLMKSEKLHVHLK